MAVFEKIDLDYGLYVKRVDKLGKSVCLDLFKVYEDSRDIFDDICFNHNLDVNLSTNNVEQSCTRHEIIGLFKYLFFNEKSNAFEIWKSLTETHDTYKNIHRVLYLLAIYCEKDMKDYEQAEQYYLLAIEKGNLHSMYNLAEYYADIVKDYEKAEQYYLMAIEAGYISAIFNLALHYEYIVKDYEKAEKYYLIAIEAGDIRAMHNLATYYDENLKDYEKAEQYYLMAIEAGNSDSMNSLALYYEYIKKNYDQAVQYFELAISLSNSDAMSNLALYYENIEKNYVKAVKYFLMGVDAGNHYAIYNLALYYVNVEGNYQKGIEYFMKGLELKNGISISPLIKVLKLNEKLCFNSVLSIVRIIVINQELHEYLEPAMSAINNTFLVWIVFQELVDVLDPKFIPLLKTLEQDFDVVQYKYKLSRASRYNVMDTCPICLNGPVLNIDIGCTHGVCPKCYVPNIQCVHCCPMQQSH